jgi:hypothetical protein
MPAPLIRDFNHFGARHLGGYGVKDERFDEGLGRLGGKTEHGRAAV